MAFIAHLFYLLIPAFLANMAPPIIASFRVGENLNVPIDEHKEMFGQRILGNNKTWRGFFVGVLVAIITSLIQFILDSYNIIVVEELSGLFDFLAFGFLSGAGALLGDMAESFFKRQLKIKSGRPFIPFDQTDYLIGFMVFTVFFFHWSVKEIIVILLFGLILNPLINLIGYKLGLKKTFW